MEQNTSEWLEWRRAGFGGSDIPIIMGLSPWSTRIQLWKEKTGKEIPDQNKYNFITDKGHRLEPKARAHYEIQTGIDAPPALVQRKDNEKFKASLDGFNPELKKNVEIKFVGQGEKWKMAINEEIPPYYFDQMQWQLYVSGAETCDYVAYNEKDDEIKIITVSPDVERIKEIVKEVKAFDKLVQTKKEPEPMAKDFIKIKDKELRKKIKRFKTLKTRMKKYESEMKDLEKEIKESEHLSDSRYEYVGVKIYTKSRKGSIDYKKVCSEKLKDIDLSGYKKPDTTYKEIRL